MKPLTITEEMSLQEMVDQLKVFIKEFGLGFHPDISAGDYINRVSGKLIFTEEEQKTFNSSLEILFEFFGDGLYSITLKNFNTL